MRMKVMRKKPIMVVPRGHDMEQMSLVKDIGGFLVRPSR